MMIGFFNAINVNMALATMSSCQKCHKEVALFFQECSKTVTYGGMVQNPNGLNQCKEAAKARKELCKRVCSKVMG